MKIDLNKFKEIKLPNRNKCDGCPFYTESVIYEYSKEHYPIDTQWCSIGYEIERDDYDSAYYEKRPLKCIKENGD